jgi:hypothetical protein
MGGGGGGGGARRRRPGGSLLLRALLAAAVVLAGASGAGGHVVELGDENFDSLTRSGAWFVDIYAPWCGALVGQARRRGRRRPCFAFEGSGGARSLRRHWVLARGRLHARRRRPRPPLRVPQVLALSAVGADVAAARGRAQIDGRFCGKGARLGRAQPPSALAPRAAPRPVCRRARRPGGPTHLGLGAGLPGRSGTTRCSSRPSLFCAQIDGTKNRVLVRPAALAAGGRVQGCTWGPGRPRAGLHLGARRPRAGLHLGRQAAACRVAPKEAATSRARIARAWRTRPRPPALCAPPTPQMMRFGVEAYPTLFLLRDGKSWQYDGARSLQSVRGRAAGRLCAASRVSRVLRATGQAAAFATYGRGDRCGPGEAPARKLPIPGTQVVPPPPPAPSTRAQMKDFALGGYKTATAMPFHKSPVSAFGRVMGALHSFPAMAKRAYTFLRVGHGGDDGKGSAGDGQGPAGSSTPFARAAPGQWGRRSCGWSGSLSAALAATLLEPNRPQPP